MTSDTTADCTTAGTLAGKLGGAREQVWVACDWIRYAHDTLRELYEAGHDYGPWALALQEAGAALAVVDAEMGDELQRERRREQQQERQEVD